MTPDDYMGVALELARQGAWTCMPNPQVGCVIVKNDQIVGRGFHQYAGQEHAEIHALRDAGEHARGADIYVTLEPCSHTGKTPPCVDALIKAQPNKVVIADTDPYYEVAGRGIAALKQHGITVEVGLGSYESQWINRGFLKRLEMSMPWVILKTASGLDGRIALPDNAEKWITSMDVRKEVHELRAASCAVITGSGTAKADDPQLTVRDVETTRQPRKILIDSRGRCPRKLRMLQDNAIVVTRTKKRNYAKGVVVIEQPDQDKIDLQRLLTELAEHWQFNSVLIEAGAGLAGAFLRNNLVDEVYAFIAPKFLGDGPATAYHGGGFNLHEQAIIKEVRRVGPDCLIHLLMK